MFEHSNNVTTHICYRGNNSISSKFKPWNYFRGNRVTPRVSQWKHNWICHNGNKVIMSYLPVTRWWKMAYTQGSHRQCHFPVLLFGNFMMLTLYAGWDRHYSHLFQHLDFLSKTWWLCTICISIWSKDKH